jgi:hypothetical protein
MELILYKSNLILEKTRKEIESTPIRIKRDRGGVPQVVIFEIVSQTPYNVMACKQTEPLLEISIKSVEGIPVERAIADGAVVVELELHIGSIRDYSVPAGKQITAT